LSVGTPFRKLAAEQLAEAASASRMRPPLCAAQSPCWANCRGCPGYSWQTADGAGQQGSFSEHPVRVQEGGLRLTLYARHGASPSILLHVYSARAADRAISTRPSSANRTCATSRRLQAVYETGSRLTHDLEEHAAIAAFR